MNSSNRLLNKAKHFYSQFIKNAIKKESNMEKDKLLEDAAIDICIQKIVFEINEKMIEYEKNKNNEIKSKIIELIKDRDLIYSNDKETIKKYLGNEKK